jgi:SAM-dependent methyltransferase
MQPAPSDRAVPQVFRHGSQSHHQDQPLSTDCRGGPSPGEARSVALRRRETVSRWPGGRHCSHRHTNDDTVVGFGARMRLLRPVPFHQRVQVFLRAESPGIPAADSPRVDFLDQNQFFASLCGAVNRRDGIDGRTWVRDVTEPDWRRDLERDYDVVVAVNAVHWFTLAGATKLLDDIFQSLRSGGVFLLMEPAGAEPLFAPGFEAWQKDQPSQHSYENWRRFWSRVKGLLGYDYGFLGDPPDDQNHIGDGPGPARTLGGLGNLGCLRPDRFIGIPFSVLLYSRRRTENNRWQTVGIFPWTRS